MRDVLIGEGEPETINDPVLYAAPEMRPPGTLACCMPVTVCAPFRSNHASESSRIISGDYPMPTPHAAAILGAVEEVRSELVGKAVVLTDGKAGTVDDIWLDELHGLRISIVGHVGKWPISTIKFAEGRMVETGSSRPSSLRQSLTAAT
jgi:hypothetical protein